MFVPLVLLLSCLLVAVNANSDSKTVLILGGGVAGIIAAKTFHEAGIDDFIIIEAQDELGGRMKSHHFGGKTVELGANWIHGAEPVSGPVNPIYTLAKKHEVKTQYNDFYGSVSTFDLNGTTDFVDICRKAFEDHVKLTIAGGERLSRSLVDLSARTGYALLGSKPQTHHEQAAEYFHFDMEYAQSPEQSSWIAQAMNANFTYDFSRKRPSKDALLSIDERGFKTVVQAEAAEFMQPSQIMFNSTVMDISYSNGEVSVTLDDGHVIYGAYVLCTFSLGVLQHDDVRFHPELPAYKQEAIQSMVMATYTKIFFKFDRKFWFDTEMGLYADPERGRYSAWQSLDHPNFFPGSGIIFVTVTGIFAERVESLPDSQVREEALGVLKQMFPDIDVPRPLDMFFYRWHSDPLYRGSYSNWPPAFFLSHYYNLRANVGRLYFAGEATSLRYVGFLHGAYDEGLNIAREIIKCIREDECAPMKRVPDITNGDEKFYGHFNMQYSLN
ncbi:amine oxidase [Armillaria borealis]|uniref:Amine oxidase n=1 Tax=Armillaria borealis TaxID=47425 RepID=A0AA39MSS1_9AGAR|nr:amine oxidase [Armillaria borealis]